jgi:hypothetical protein
MEVDMYKLLSQHIILWLNFDYIMHVAVSWKTLC